jgi:biopolymer transport protein TolR
MAPATNAPLSPAQRAKIRRLSTPAEPGAGEEGAELNVVPYLDIIMNVMMFVLATVSVTFASTIPTAAAAVGPRTSGPPEGLRLTAMVTGGGVALATADGAIAAGCDRIGPGLTVPSNRGAYDLAGLSACARRIKGARPERATETQVTVTASPDVPYATVVAVMDALRRDDAGDLFPEARLGVVR